MSDRQIKVLLIEDNPGDARLVREMLAESGEGRFVLYHAERLSTGLDRLSKADFDVVLTDLSLPDTQGLETFARVHRKRTQSVKNIFDQLLKKGQKAGLLREGLNREIIQIFFMEAVINFIENPQLVGKNYSPEEVYNTVRSVFLYGILQKEAKK